MAQRHLLASVLPAAAGSARVCFITLSSRLHGEVSANISCELEGCFAYMLNVRQTGFLTQEAGTCFTLLWLGTGAHTRIATGTGGLKPFKYAHVRKGGHNMECYA